MKAIIKRTSPVFFSPEQCRAEIYDKEKDKIAIVCDDKYRCWCKAIKLLQLSFFLLNWAHVFTSGVKPQSVKENPYSD